MDFLSLRKLIVFEGSGQSQKMPGYCRHYSQGKPWEMVYQQAMRHQP
jgi:hypothetical protein